MDGIGITVLFDGNDQSISNLAERLADSIRLWCLERGLNATVLVFDQSLIVEEGQKDEKPT